VNGEVDSSGRALIALKVRSCEDAEPAELKAWVDTAFTGELVVPRRAIRSLGLRQSAAIAAGLADETDVVLETYGCVIEWFGEQRPVEVIQSDGPFPLLGTGLLRNRILKIDCRSRSLVIE
jgi:clan AA aspartic protease